MAYRKTKSTCSRKFASRMIVGLTLVVGMPCASSMARADQVLAGDQKYRQANIVGYSKGFVEIAAEHGATKRLGVWTVDIMVIDEEPHAADMNQAEEFLMRNQSDQAIDRYERALRNAYDFWPDLIRARLLIAADRAGQFDKAVRVFLTVAEADPVAAAYLMPASLPTTQGRGAARTMNRLQDAIDGARGKAMRPLLELLQYAALRSLGDAAWTAKTAEVAGMQLPGDLITPRTSAVRLEALGALLDSGAYQDAADAADAALAMAPKSLTCKLLVIKARALLAAAKEPEDYLAAALPAMRAAIHFADTPQAGEGLVLAAEAHERSGRVPDAVRLLRACLANDAANGETKDQARSELARLTNAPKAATQ